MIWVGVPSTPNSENLLLHRKPLGSIIVQPLVQPRVRYKVLRRIRAAESRLSNIH